MTGLELYEKVRSVPEDAKKPIKGGRLSGMTDINPMWRIKALTDNFGPCGIGWYYVPIQKWLETCGNEVAAFVDIELYIKVDGEWSQPIYGTGGSMLASKEKNGIYVSDECYKMATTDAISVACKQLGVGADVYWENDRTKYNKENAAKDIKKEYLPEVYVNTVFSELKRTGVGRKNICKKYGITDIREMDINQFVDAVEILKAKPDKPIDPATIPPEDLGEELPWATPQE